MASNPSQPTSSVVILSGFNANNGYSLHYTPTCQLNAQWPSSYGDVYFGADGCLYDAQRNKINIPCCSTPDSTHSGLTTNPYCGPAPPSPSQTSGNNHGSSICLSINGGDCKSAAQRFQDDIVYHQYTSAVWPDSSGADIANLIFPIFGPLFGINYGCTVIWKCDNSGAYNQGMTGAQIKNA